MRSNPTTLRLRTSLITLLGLPVASLAGEAGPFYAFNMNPFTQVFAQPYWEGGRIAEAGRLESRFLIDAANYSSSSTSGQESILMDGESWRGSLVLRYGIGQRFEIGADIAYVRHEGGVLDGLIDDWHELLSLPSPERDSLPNNELQIGHNVNGTTTTDVSRSASGFGDVRLLGGWQILDNRRGGSLALRLGLKLPSGDPDSLTGSGGTDWSLTLSGTSAGLNDSGTLTLYGGLGVLMLGTSEVLGQQTRDLVGLADLGIDWRIFPRVSLRAQLDANTAFYDSGLRELGDGSLQLLLGGSVRFTDRTALDIAVGEDLIVQSSPDVALHFGLQHRFQ